MIRSYAVARLVIAASSQTKLHCDKYSHFLVSRGHTLFSRYRFQYKRPFSSGALILKAITPLRENRVWLRETSHFYRFILYLYIAIKICESCNYDYVANSLIERSCKRSINEDIWSAIDSIYILLHMQV